MDTASKSSRWRLDSVWARIAVAYAALMIVCVVGLTAYLVIVGDGSYLATLHHDAEAEAQLVSVAVQPYLVGGGRQAEVDALVKRLGEKSGLRVTVIDPSGVVLGDSESDPASMENHRQRPEVQVALEGVTGENSRRSATVGYEMMYVAVPLKEQSRVLGVVRVAVPLESVRRTEEEIGWAMALGGVVATGLAVLMALLIARRTTGPIEALTEVAGRMAEGELEWRAGNYSQDEVGRLARAFDLMADRLRATIKAISDERNTLAAVLSTMADGTVIVDGRGKVMLANRAAGQLLRMPVSSMEGRSYVEVLRDHDLSSVLRRCLERGTQETGTTEVEPDRRLVRIVAAPLRGELEGALALLQDLTEVRRAETVRREFVANVSHELRTPLASLKALAETLEGGAMGDPDVARDFLSKMHGEVDGLAQLVSELLELSRIESGQTALRKEPVDPVWLVQQAADRLSAQAARAGLELTVEAGSVLPEVMADGQRVEQVLVNLIHNAIKFTPPGGRITVKACEGEGEVEVSVSDSGVGIAREDLPRIFERFFKADRSRSGGGTGLGLAIAKHIVQAHGGRIWAESVEGHGSVFHFTLPVSPIR